MPDPIPEPVITTCSSELWRVGRASHVLRFSSIQAEDAASPRNGNRFDVPGGEVLYAATSAEGAFAETISRFRPTAASLLLTNEDREHFMAPGSVPAEWRTRRRLVRFSVNEPLPFLDVDKPETHTFLTAQMAPTLDALEIDNLDNATLRGTNRLLTRAVAEWAYTAQDDDGNFFYGGLRYESRLGPHECWAIFSGATIELKEELPIERTDTSLLTTARGYGLVIH
ncbi:MAG: RES family NAD+ phosphorylase [Rhodoglobus sp.]